MYSIFSGTRLVCVILICKLWAPALGISSMSLTNIKDGGLLEYALTVVDRTNFVSMIRCASLCERNGRCVAVAICPESSRPSATCGLISVNVMQSYNHGDSLTGCSVHYSRHRFENLLSCGASPLPDQALVACSTTTTTPVPATTACVTSLGGGCQCPKGATNLNCTEFITDCSQAGWDQDVFTIQPQSYPTPFQVYCDRSKLKIQRRKGCDENFFHRSWQEYKEGFGYINGTCFWLGNDKIGVITNQDDYTLRVKPSQGILASSSKYTSFKLGTETERYSLQYTNFETHAWMDSSKDGFGDCDANLQLLGMKFYTHDNDNGAGCATNRKSGWWYNSACAFGDLNQYGSAKWPRTIDAVLTDYDDVSMTLTTNWP